ncbi:hypothetical protein JKP88DRAFT_160699 [Tribonema minus]|uniref:G-patch domain-containing protein n=1 Tax=Tribonema minus TaxID=303371 RepID=A0A835Z8F6_9STRA|nr:hypothetical protein JKP88DRAFT_160699 [Tribonema minus]
MNGVLGKRALKDLGARANDAAGSGYSSFSQRMMTKMGWQEGQGLGKDGQGMNSYIKVKRKEDDAGLGREKQEREKAANQWYFNAFEDAIAAAHALDPKLRKKLKNKGEKKRKREVNEATIYQEMFEKSGGARMGMRARASQKAKWERTLDAGSAAATTTLLVTTAAAAAAASATESLTVSVTDPVALDADAGDGVESAETLSSSEESATDGERAAQEADRASRLAAKRRRKEAAAAAAAAVVAAEAAETAEETKEQRRARKAAKKAKRRKLQGDGGDE